MATTITVSTRVIVSDVDAGDILLKLQDAAKSTLGAELLSGTVLTQTTFSNPESGVRTKTSKMDTVYTEGPSEHDLNEAWGV